MVVNQWLSGLLESARSTLEDELKVEGQIKKHLGPTHLVASGTAIVSPSDALKVDVGEYAGEAQEFALAFAFGILDVMLTRPTGGIGRIEIQVTSLAIDEINSTVYAFRLAGRYGATAAIDENIWG
ncbi:MAG: hypothetical protein AAGC56_00520 [Pseudomonadota bacterium]